MMVVALPFIEPLLQSLNYRLGHEINFLTTSAMSILRIDRLAIVYAGHSDLQRVSVDITQILSGKIAFFSLVHAASFSDAMNGLFTM